VATGSVASAWFADHPPIDALIIGSIDEPAGGGRPAPARRTRSRRPAGA
jgi:hypothetical protein